MSTSLCRGNKKEYWRHGRDGRCGSLLGFARDGTPPMVTPPGPAGEQGVRLLSASNWTGFQSTFNANHGTARLVTDAGAHVGTTAGIDARPWHSSVTRKISTTSPASSRTTAEISPDFDKLERYERHCGSPPTMQHRSALGIPSRRRSDVAFRVIAVSYPHAELCFLRTALPGHRIVNSVLSRHLAAGGWIWAAPPRFHDRSSTSWWMCWPTTRWDTCSPDIRTTAQACSRCSIRGDVTRGRLSHKTFPWMPRPRRLFGRVGMLCRPGPH